MTVAEGACYGCGTALDVRGAPCCAVHARPLICPSCVGARGGKVGGKASSPRKTRAARRNAKRPRPAARTSRYRLEEHPDGTWGVRDTTYPGASVMASRGTYPDKRSALVRVATLTAADRLEEPGA